MNILDAILDAQGGGAVRQMSQQFGLSDNQTMSALSALVPALAAGVQRNTQQAGGLESLVAALSGGQHQQYMNDLPSLGNAATMADGNGILGHIFGSKDVSRQVATRAAQQTGIDAGILKQMLPLAAALMMGAMARQGAGAGAGAGLGSGLGGDPGSGLMGMLTPLLDSNRDGSMIDDVIGMLGKLGR
jgi:hypothetical protein